ncbi:MAG: CDP-diacylglycerol--serine O-phosphatidyltransferase [Chromatiaceae bacterium]|nr:CDP-diacylglycerol--serine O-phosphatidyltransferase [Chromatiaceae bacterium]MCP5421526.1 CDP-diacylglycerol--serine O-phosphatidyltransferase [Chromatiaceae bacterium]
MEQEPSNIADLEQERPKRARGIYLLPNLFTTAALFAGFYAVLAAMNDQFEKAAIAIFVAMVLDGLDGRVARLTNTQTAFGAEYDSLSDMVAFGLAPSLVMYEWGLHTLGKLGWLAAFIYTAGAALRLARFNSQLDTADKRYFTGLPSPSAAAIMAGFVWVVFDNALPDGVFAWPAMLLTAAAGLLMVSNIRYHSFKQIDLKGKVPFVVVVAVMLAFAVILSEPPIVLFALFLAYTLSGPLLALRRMLGRSRGGGEQPPAEQG